MRSLSRISVTIDRPNCILVVRLFSRRAVGTGPGLMDHLNAINQPWRYDAIFDFRRYEADLTDAYVGKMAEAWGNIENGRDMRKRLAVITSDPCLRRHLAPLGDALPGRSATFFDTFDEGLDWLHAARRAAA